MKARTLLAALVLLTGGCSSVSSVCLGGVCSGDGEGAGGGVYNPGIDCPTDLALTSVEVLPNVTAEVRGDTVRIRFDPNAEAVDYRVYELPAPGAVSGDVIANAIHRCAGEYAIPPMQTEQPPEQSFAFSAYLEGDVLGYTRAEADATLGWVFTTPGDGRVPVYALGDSALDGDNGDCFFQRYPESRRKRYTTSEEERAALLTAHWRDDGIAFYAPAPGTAGAISVVQVTVDENPLYVTEGGEYDERVANGLSSTVGSEAWNSRDLKSRPH